MDGFTDDERPASRETEPEWQARMDEIERSLVG